MNAIRFILQSTSKIVRIILCVDLCIELSKNIGSVFLQSNKIPHTKNKVNPHLTASNGTLKTEFTSVINVKIIYIMFMHTDKIAALEKSNQKHNIIFFTSTKLIVDYNNINVKLYVYTKSNKYINAAQ